MSATASRPGSRPRSSRRSCAPIAGEHVGEAQVAIERIGAEEPARTSRTTPLARAFVGAIADAGGKATFKVKSGTSDMNILAPAWGCPMVAYGPGDSRYDHTPMERLVTFGLRALDKGPAERARTRGQAHNLTAGRRGGQEKGRKGVFEAPTASARGRRRPGDAGGAVRRFRAPHPALRHDAPNGRLRPGDRASPRPR